MIYLRVPFDDIRIKESFFSKCLKYYVQLILVLLSYLSKTLQLTKPKSILKFVLPLR